MWRAQRYCALGYGSTISNDREVLLLALSTNAAFRHHCRDNGLLGVARDLSPSTS